jgi:cell division protein ZapA
VNRESKKVSVEIFGEPYVIRGTSPEDYIRDLAKEVDRRMHEVSLRSPRLAVHQVATLVALNLADELAKIRDEQKTVMDLLGEKEEE